MTPHAPPERPAQRDTRPNYRSICATNRVDALPADMVAKWLGHRPLMAAKHSLPTRDAHFEGASRGFPRVGEAEAQAAPIRATA